jgi:hypothetical protein
VEGLVNGGEEDEYEIIPNNLLAVDRIKEAAFRGNLDYWSRSEDEKPNLPRRVFVVVIRLMPYTVTFKRPKRKSLNGVHGHDGDEHVFMTEFEVEFQGRDKGFFIKGYFFPKNANVGMTIQSFRHL